MPTHPCSAMLIFLIDVKREMKFLELRREKKGGKGQYSVQERRGAKEWDSRCLRRFSPSSYSQPGTFHHYPSPLPFLPHSPTSPWQPPIRNSHPWNSVTNTSWCLLSVRRSWENRVNRGSRDRAGARKEVDDRIEEEDEGKWIWGVGME